MSRLDERVARTFVELADTLVAGFDLVEFLDLLAARCVELLDVDAAGLLLLDQHGELTVLAASSEQSRLLELFELQDQEGPCLDCFRSEQPVECPDLDEAAGRWPRFTRVATQLGFHSVYALPMRLRDDIIGALNLFRRPSDPLGQDMLAFGQALADVATIGILHERAVRQREVVTEQLQGALNSRIVIEQAKGVLAERRGVSVADAFTMMRAYARNNGLRLADVARGVVHQTDEVRPLTMRSVGPGPLGAVPDDPAQSG